MSMQKAYSEDILPLVERVALIGKQTGMPMFMTFEESPESFVTTCLNASRCSSEKLQLHMIVNDVWTIDDMFRKVVKNAQEKGHDSIYLKAMGIPNRPGEKRPTPKRDI